MEQQESLLYETAAREVHENKMIHGLYIKAFSEVGNDKEKIAALYIRYRVQQLKDEIANQQKEAIKQKGKVLLVSAQAGFLQWFKRSLIIMGCIVATWIVVLMAADFTWVFSLGYALGVVSVASAISLTIALPIWSFSDVDLNTLGIGKWFYLFSLFTKYLPFTTLVLLVFLMLGGIAF